MHEVHDAVMKQQKGNTKGNTGGPYSIAMETFCLNARSCL